MIHEFNALISRAAASLELVTIIAATAVVMLGVLRSTAEAALHRSTEREVTIVRSYCTSRNLVIISAAIAIFAVFVLDVSGEFLRTATADFRLSSAAFLFAVWAVTITAVLHMRRDRNVER